MPRQVLLALLLVAGACGDPAPVAAPAPPPEPEREDPNRKKRKKALWWIQQQFYDDFSKYKALTGREIHDLFAEAEKRGYPELLGKQYTDRQRKIYTRLLKREPDDPDANRFFGRVPLSQYPSFYKVFRALTDEPAPPGDLVALRNTYEGRVRFGPHWRAPAVEPKEFERVSALLREYEAFRKRMQDPTEAAIHAALARVKVDPILGEYPTVHITRPPWVLFYAHKDLAGNDRDQVAARLTKRLESYTRLLDDYLAFFHERWIKPLGLQPFKKGQLFYVWMFDDRKRFDEFGLKQRMVHPPGLLGYFSHRDHWVYLYEPSDDRMKVETSLAHELTHQLHWHFSKDTGQFKNHYRRVKATWFKEGWAEYVGWCERDKDGGYLFARNAATRMEAIHLCHEKNLPLIPVRDLVKAENYLQFQRWVLEWQPALARKLGARIVTDLYMELLYAQGWLLVRFLYEKHPDKALAFTKATLKGYLGHVGNRGYATAAEVFADILQLKTSNDWKDLQRDYDAFVRDKMAQLPPKK
ncbi:MAG: hypothetical protein ACYTGN_16295 [Planctomycetota bacterium]|jgi:hypothetical protein